MSAASSPNKTDSSVYNSALESTLNSTFGSDKIDISLLTDSDAENLNTTLLDYTSPAYGTPISNFLSDKTNSLISSERSPNNNSTTFGIDESTVSISTLSINSTIDATSDEVIIISSDSEMEDDEIDNEGDSTPLLGSQKSVQIKTEFNESKETIANISSIATDGADSGIKIYNSIEEFDANLPETITLLKTPYGSKVYLVGTAHFSENSQNDVSLAMRNVCPDVVMLELCPSRVHILKYDEKTLLEEAKDINMAKIRTIIRTNGIINGLFYIVLLNMSAKITKKLGMAPGGEFRRALEEAGKLEKCVVQLGDRQINITLQRALRALSLWQTIKLIPKLLVDEDITFEEIEECKKKDLLEELMLELTGEFPALGRVFVQERDLYLCHSLQVAAMTQTMADGVSRRPVTVVGVVGIGHAAGIAKLWGTVDPQSIPHILVIPPAPLSTRIFKFTFKYGMLGLGIYGLFRYVRPKIQNIL